MFVTLAAAILLAQTNCDRYPAIAGWPAPVIPAALAAKYPDGAQLTADVTVDASGKVTSIDYDSVIPVPHDLRSAFGAWLHRAQYAPGATRCAPSGGVARVTQDFFPAASGILGSVPLVGGVDFGNLTYTPGPCYPKEPAELHDGTYSYLSSQATTQLTVSVDEAYAGKLDNQPIAVVVLRCDFPIGFNAEARVYRVSGGKPVFLATAGTFALPGGDSPMPATGWIHVSFAQEKLYVDTWTYGEKFWLVKTYGLNDGKLVTLYSEHHQRSTPLPGNR